LKLEQIPVTSYSSRPFTAADLGLLIDFASRCTAARAPRLTYWNPGDIAWQLAGFPSDFDFSGTVRLWTERSGDVAALAIFEPPLNFEFDAAPWLAGAEGVMEEAVSWAEARRAALSVADGDIPKAYNMFDRHSITTTSLDSDAARNRFLEGRGYQRTERHSVRYSRQLSTAIPAPTLPPGMSLRRVTAGDVEARAELHRDAWSVWGASKFSAESYRRTRAASIYDESLDIVVEDESGRLLSYCIAWFDRENGIGHFEPVGTRPALANRGLGRAVVLEGLRRLRERGAHTALIGTASVNAPALRTYTACGFEFVERQHYWTKTLPPRS
jgi:ribosomal protein S18 acetylase RimI-like enzyme